MTNTNQNKNLEEILDGKKANDIDSAIVVQIYKQINKKIENKYNDFCNSELYEASTLTADFINKKTGMPKGDVYKLLIEYYELIAGRANNMALAAGAAFPVSGDDYYYYRGFAQIYENTISKIKKQIK